MTERQLELDLGDRAVNQSQEDRVESYLAWVQAGEPYPFWEWNLARTKGEKTRTPH